LLAHLGEADLGRAGRDHGPDLPAERAGREPLALRHNDQSELSLARLAESVFVHQVGPELHQLDARSARTSTRPAEGGGGCIGLHRYRRKSLGGFWSHKEIGRRGG
jgi:hypothetical protein